MKVTAALGGSLRRQDTTIIIISLSGRLQEEKMPGDFYIRYYVGHKGKFGHEFLEFEFRPDGKLLWR